ncbi:hypothetical protein STSV2_14 [Sulfolobus virus STSV2]|uniref:hypothetical protein n=1 Tax=Sulfolobus virus STSV2 TaxID=1123964 RepID=UPI0002A7DE60|nr:hypothetical protein STSV2_14 [Sulfolobus virus STSV2]AFU91993.1 hypothetical protein STSV2_14 [Sulfolobus virus STSV2]
MKTYLRISNLCYIQGLRTFIAKIFPFLNLMRTRKIRDGSKFAEMSCQFYNFTKSPFSPFLSLDKSKREKMNRGKKRWQTQ